MDLHLDPVTTLKIALVVVGIGYTGMCFKFWRLRRKYRFLLEQQSRQQERPTPNLAETAPQARRNR